jgi:hypothetical protein
MPCTVGEARHKPTAIAEGVCSLDAGGGEAICNIGADVGDECAHAVARTGSGTTLKLKLKLFTTRTVCAGFYTKSRMRRLLSLGPPNYAIQGTYKSGLDH